MSDLDFTEKDFELLLEALDAWESQPIDTGMANGLMAMMMIGADQTRDARGNALKGTMDQAIEKKRHRSQMVIILKAKVEVARQKLQQAGIAAEKAVDR